LSIAFFWLSTDFLTKHLVRGLKLQIGVYCCLCVIGVQNHNDQSFSRHKDGLNDAIAFAKGDKTRGVVHQIVVPNVDVAAIRAKTGLSQRDFAQSIGVSKGTLLNWEQGRRRPTGPAQVLLAMIERQPSLVRELLRAD
jgi:putative transcriptional regulator